MNFLTKALGTHSPLLSPKAMLQTDASLDTLSYMKSEMRNATLLSNRYEVLQYAINTIPDKGVILEFGVRKGDTINYIAKHANDRQIFGFDSFEGLPEDWKGFVCKQGEFSQNGKLPSVRSNVTLTKGWFDDVLPDFSQRMSETIALLHIDSDLYSSAKTIFENLASKIKTDTIIVFDEYFNYPNWRNHEYKAFQEFCTLHRVKYDYIAIGYHQVAVKIISINLSA